MRAGDVCVVFRTGGGECLGFGHVRRCLSLADALCRGGVRSFFLLDGDVSFVDRAREAGFEAASVCANDDLQHTVAEAVRHRARAIVADAYAFSPEYLSALGQASAKTVVIDDMGDRDVPVDVVVNGSVGAERLRYRGAEHTRFFLGPRYILLRPQFAQTVGRRIGERVRNVLVTVGGSDPHGLTARLLHDVRHTLPDALVDVVVGPLFTDCEQLEVSMRSCGDAISLHHDPHEIMQLMLNADLALSGGGQTTYELAACGTPTIAIRTAGNQTVNLMGFASAGALIWAGDVSDVDLDEKVKRAVAEVDRDREGRATLSRRAQALIDGRGAQRVAQIIATGMSEP